MRNCIFCGGRANSHEHAWPKWILDLDGKQYAIGGYRGDDAHSVFLKGPNAEIKTRHVCRVRCNNGWMSTLEGRTKDAMMPMILDSPKSISQDEQATIAQWCIKTGMVFEYLRAGQEPKYFTAQERHDLMSGLTIPRHTFVWLGHYVGDWNLVTAGAELRDADPKVPPDGVVYTFTAGRLAIQCLTVSPDAEDTPIRLRIRPGPWPTALVQIWPAQATVNWPPPTSFGDDPPVDLELLVGRLGPPGVKVPMRL